MIKTNTLTIVYTIKDHDAFKSERQRVNDNFKPLEDHPWAITSMSLGHEIQRLNLIEEAHENKRYDLLDEIFGLVDPVKIRRICDLIGY